MGRTAFLRVPRLEAETLPTMRQAPVCLPGSPCPSCGQHVAEVKRSASFVVNGERERQKWTGRVAVAIADALGTHECDAYRIFAKMAERVGEPAPEDGDHRFNIVDLTDDLGISNTTLHARWRAQSGLPPLKQYIDGLYLVRAAAIAEAFPEEPCYRHARRLGFNHPQPYNRWLKRASGLTPAEFAKAASEKAELMWYIGMLVTPHVETLRREHFLAADVRVPRRLEERGAL
jgi:AraC-like DNA-binding protein